MSDCFECLPGPDASPSRTEEEAPKEHLLSIFPLHDAESYARVSCLALERQNIECAAPFVCQNRYLLAERLSVVFDETALAEILESVDAGIAVHRSITSPEARLLGFQPLIH